MCRIKRVSKIAFDSPTTRQSPQRERAYTSLRQNVYSNLMKKKMFVEMKCTNDKLNCNYVSLSNHPPIIDKKPLVGHESILRGNESSMEFKDEMKENTKIYSLSRWWSVCKC